MLELGEVTLTSRASEELHYDDTQTALDRHSQGDWGDVHRLDWETNDWAVENAGLILSRYQDRHAQKFCIITNCDRASTTILMPEER